MAIFTRDTEYEKGKELLEKLEGVEGDLIRYYVSSKDELIEKQQETIRQMKAVFKSFKFFSE